MADSNVDFEKIQRVYGLMKNRMISLILLPLAIVLWMIGWSMLLAAFNKEQKNRPVRKETTSGENLVTVMPVIPEEIEA